MKKVAFLLALCVLAPALASGASISWTAPATYTDNTPIPQEKIPTIKYRLYSDMVEFGVVVGATQWEGTLPQQPGEVKSYTATAELDGQTSAHSPPTTFAWFLPTNAPGSVVIQLGNP